MAEAALTERRRLDDVMLAMDVVDTLRHRRHLVERELYSEQRDDKLIERLREIYASQGIEVPDHVLNEGVVALREERFIYKPPRDGVAVSWARVYIERGKWARRAGIAVGIAALVGSAYWFFVVSPVKQLPDELAGARDAVVATAKAAMPAEQAEELYARGLNDLQAGDVAQAKAAVKQLNKLRTRLEQEYVIRVVSRPGEASGIQRIPDHNPAARNHYIIVEAVAPDGTLLPQAIKSEEDGRVARLKQWGLRVNEQVYNRIRTDKLDDGIVQNYRFGHKERGYLVPDYTIPTTGGAITHW